MSGAGAGPTPPLPCGENGVAGKTAIGTPHWRAPEEAAAASTRITMAPPASAAGRGGSGGAAHVSLTEDEWLAWFREGRATLQNDLERHFEAAAPAAPSAIDLLAILPRNQSHSAHLLAAQQLPVTEPRSAVRG